MRKLFLCLLMALFAMTATLKAQVIVFTDGFENGLNPTSGAPERIEGDLQWSQEYYVPATTSWTTVAPAWSQSWKTETGGARPENAVSGKGRAYFRNEHGQTEGYKTRLVTPWMNLDGVYQPILRFYHAQNKWTADFDTLRVFYRSGKGTAWSVLAEYKEPIKKWTFEELDLPNTGADYQLAFEASENLGYGIVLDSVLVRSKPQITTPYNVQLLDQRDNGVTIQWQASMDADEYQFVFASENLDLNVNPDAINNKEVIIKDTLIDSDVFSLRMENMASGKTYYVQIRSIGETENSVWCDPVMVYNKPTVKLPYTEEFEIPQLEGTKLWNDTWTWGGALPPISLCWVGQTSWQNYSYNNTGAVGYTGLLDNGNRTNERVLPGGVTAYMATPEISLADGEKISDCHVSFWGSVYTFTTNSNTSNAPEYARSIIVGIMTDPQDLTTFEAIDTCFVWGYKEFVNFDVSFASYKGEGRYVAFLSDFEIQNLFYIDGVTIEKRPAVAAVKRSSVSVVPTTTTATLTWEPAEGATSYNVKYVKTTRKGEDLPLYAYDLTNATIVPASTNSITLEGLTPGAQYDFAIQGVGGAWSQPDAFFTSVVIDALPITFSFEENENHGSFEGTYYRRDNTHKIPYGWLSYTSEADCPYIYTTSGAARTGTGAVGLQANRYTDAWLVSPMIDTLNSLEISFYIKQYGTTYPSSFIEVGVMTDPSDLSTFETISTFMAQPNYARCYVNFLDYKGKGKYVALNWGRTSDGLKNSLYIDDLTIKDLDPCPMVSKLDITELKDTLVTIAWPAAEDPGVTYNIKLSKSEIAEAELATKEGDIANITGYTANSLTVDTLDWSTSYYFYIQKVCSETLKSEWSGTYFTTACPEKLKMPYSTDFTKEGKTGTGSLPFCWTPAYNSTTTTYPYITTSTYANSGNALYMYSYTTYGSFISLPEIDAPWDDICLSFYAATATSNYILYVGVMTDQDDTDTFVKLDSVKVPTTSTPTFHTTTFANYTGAGKHIAFSTFNGKSNTIYLSNVSVTSLTNAAPVNIVAAEATDTSLVAQWDGKTTGEWKVVVTNKEYKAALFDPAVAESENTIVSQGQVAQSRYAITGGLKAQTHYYCYVRSTDGTKWGMGDVMTECKRLNPRDKVSESFESYGKTVISSLTSTATYPGYFKNALVPDCWTVGNSTAGVFDWSKATTYTNRNYFPYVCSNGTGTTSLTNYYDKGTALSTYSYTGISSATENNFNSLKMYGYYSGGGVAWAAMPAMDIADDELSSLVLSFSYQKTAANSTLTAAAYGNALIVGLMEDPTDLSTFHALDSLYQGNGTGKGKSINYELVFSDALVEHPEAKGKHIAFRTSINSGTSTTYAGKAATTTVYLDNINVSLASCMAPSPSITQLTDSSARVYSGLRIDNAWQYILSLKQLKASDLDEGTMPAPADIIKQETIGDGSEQVPYVPLNNLLPDTTYYVALQTMCPPDGGSAWKVVSFKTLCEYIDVETFEEDFEGYDTGSGSSVGCWTVGNLNPAATVAYIPFVDGTGLTGSKKVLKLYSYKSTANGAYAVSPGLKFPEGKSIKDYQVRFTVLPSSSLTSLTQSSSYEYSVCVGVLDNPANISSLVTIDTLVYAAPDVTTATVDFGSYTGKGQFVVFYNFATDKNYNYMYIDDVKFELAPTCKNAIGVVVDSVAEKEAWISWRGAAAKYNVAVSKVLYPDSLQAAMLASDSAKLADGVIMKTVEAKSAKLEGLTPMTDYYVYVQSVCSETETSSWGYVHPILTTGCYSDGAPVPFKENFNKYGSSTKAVVACWEFADYGTSPGNYPYTYKPTSGAQSGTMLELWSTSTTHRGVAIMPMVKGDLSDYMLSFDTRPYSGTATATAVLFVGTMSDIEDQTTFVAFDTINITGGLEFTHRDYLLADYNLAHNRIAFCSGLGETVTASDVLVDNVRLGMPVKCYTPSAIKVLDPTYNSVILKFTADGDGDEWDAVITNIATKVETNIKITSDSLELTGLEPNTTYSIKLRSDCGEEKSDWSDPVLFSTKWKVDTYTWTFDKNEQNTISQLTPTATSTTYIIHPALISTAGEKTLAYSSSYSYMPYQVYNTATIAYASDPSKCVAGGDTAYAMKFYTTATYDSAAIILPTIIQPNAKRISWKMRAGSAYCSDHATATSRNVVYNVYRNAKLYVGTVDSLKGLETFTKLAEFIPSPLTLNDTLKASSNYGWDYVTFSLKDVNMTNKQIAFMMLGGGTSYIYMDDLAVEEDKGFTTPAIKSLAPDANSITVNIDGDASRVYNILVVDTAKAGVYSGFMPYIQDVDPDAISIIKGVHALSYTISGLESRKSFMVYVEDSLAAANGLDGALSARQITRTTCEAVDGNGFFTNFMPGNAYFQAIAALENVDERIPKLLPEDGFEFILPNSVTAQDTVYKYPSCWTMSLGSYDITNSSYKGYAPIMFGGSKTTYEFGKGDRYALSMGGRGSTSAGDSYDYGYNTSTYADMAMAVMPLLNLDMDTAEVQFWGRCARVTASTKKISAITYIKGGSTTAYSQKVAVGTVTNPQDPSTFVALDTVEYNKYTSVNLSTSSIATADNDYFFQKFNVRLKGAAGKYIAFKQIGYGMFFIDDLSIQKAQTCRVPADLVLDALSDTAIMISWRGRENENNYILEFSKSATNWETATVYNVSDSSHLLITGLEPATEYFARVAQISTEFGTSEFSVAESGRTGCSRLNPNGYKTGFECDANQGDPWYLIPGVTTATYKQNQCWSYLNHGTTALTSSGSTSWPYNIQNTSSSRYAVEGAYSLKLYAYSTTYKGVAVTPEIDAEIGVPGKGFDTLQVHFWASPTYVTISTGKFASSGTTYAKTVEVGTCTDPNDPETYTVLQVCTYEVPGNNITTSMVTSEAEHWGFKEFTVKLNKATGPYVFLRASKIMADGAEKTYSTMYIDNLEFQKIRLCEAPASASVTDVNAYGATIAWEDNDALGYDLDVATDPSFSDSAKFVYIAKGLTAKSVTLSDTLKPATVYYYRVRSFCDAAREEESVWLSSGLNFRTAFVPIFNENFNTEDLKSTAKGWVTMSRKATAKEVFDGAALQDTATTAVYDSWYRVQNYALTGYALRSYLYYTSSSYDYYFQKNWLVSPSIYVESDKANLTFNAALTHYNITNTSADKDIRQDAAWNTGWDDQFMVIISEDNGATWKKENATIWNNEISDDPASEHYLYGKGQYVLTDIPANGEQLMVDLSAYKGKLIKIAFYAENTVQNAKTAIHIDNIHVNYLTHLKQEMELCQFEDIDDVLGFNVDGDKAAVGYMPMKKVVLSSKPGVNDSIYELNATYLEAPQYEYSITVCKDHPFSWGGFNEHSAPGTYRMKLKSKVTGCDSIVDFHLSHIEKFERDIDTTLCYGASITIGNHTYTEAGAYSDTLVSALGGCDSIINLTLNYRPRNLVMVYDTINVGDTYLWEGESFEVTTMGYEKTFVDQFGCDSIRQLNLLVFDPTVIYTNMTTCQGTPVTWRGKQYSEAAEYRDTVMEAGVEKVYALVLVVNPVDEVSIRETICDGNFFEFNNEKLTKTGTYTATFSNQYGCDSIVTLNLTVQMPTAQTINAEICQGTFYEFAGQQLTKSGIYYDTTYTSLGCVDVTTILNLVVAEPLKGAMTKEICEGDAFTFNGKTYSESGVYTDTLSTEAGCDSILTITIIQTMDVHDTIIAYVCPGETYKDQYFDTNEPGKHELEITTPAGCRVNEVLYLYNYQIPVSKTQKIICQGSYVEFGGRQYSTTGVYTDTLKGQSAQGCDSVAVLELFVLDADTMRVNVTIQDTELPYAYEGTPIDYEVGTLPGTYVDTVSVQIEGCEAVIIHTLVIQETQAIDNVNSTPSMVLRPTLLDKGQVVYIDYDFTAADKQDLNVEVTDMLGKLVSSKKVDGEDLQVSDFPVSGIYTIRVTSGTGLNMTGRVVVR